MNLFQEKNINLLPQNTKLFQKKKYIHLWPKNKYNVCPKYLFVATK